MVNGQPLVSAPAPADLGLVFALNAISALDRVPAFRSPPSPARRPPPRTACRTAGWRRCRSHEAVRNGRGLGRIVDRGIGRARPGCCSTMITSCCGWVRNAIAHSTSAEVCTSISGSTMTIHFGRMLLDMARGSPAAPRRRSAVSSRSPRRTTRRPTRAPTRLSMVGNWRLERLEERCLERESA